MPEHSPLLPLSSPSPPPLLPGQSSEETISWVQVLNDTIRELQKPKPPVSPVERTEGGEEGRGGEGRGEGGEGRGRGGEREGRVEGREREG